jgi:hypothetical protein
MAAKESPVRKTQILPAAMKVATVVVAVSLAGHVTTGCSGPECSVSCGGCGVAFGISCESGFATTTAHCDITYDTGSPDEICSGTRMYEKSGKTYTFRSHGCSITVEGLGTATCASGGGAMPSAGPGIGSPGTAGSAGSAGTTGSAGTAGPGGTGGASGSVGIPVTTGNAGTPGPGGTGGASGLSGAAGTAARDASAPDLAMPDAAPSCIAHASRVSALAVRADGSLLASSGGSVVKLWHLPDGKPLKALTGHSGVVGPLSISGDGALLASGGVEEQDDTIKLWSLPEGNLQTMLTSTYLTGVRALAFAPDAKVLASVGLGSSTFNNEVTLWDLPAGTATHLPSMATELEAVAVSNDGKTIVAAGYSQVEIRALPAPTKPRSLPGRYPIAVSRDGLLLAYGGGGASIASIRVVDLPDGTVPRTLGSHPGGFIALAFSPSGKLLASGGYDHKILLWNVADGALLKTLEAHTDWVTALAFSPDETLLLSGSQDKSIRRWSLPDGMPLGCLTE